MQDTHGLRFQWSTNQFLLATALFLTAFANLAFFRNLAVTFADTPWGLLHMLSLALVLWCTTLLFLSLLSFRPLLKPVLILLLLISAVSAYFMDTYNVIIDQDMLVNVMATNSAESADLLTPRFFAYVGLLGLLPSLLLWRIRIRPSSFRHALGSRLLLVGGAVLISLALVLISWILIDSAAAQMVSTQGQTVWQTLVKWTPLMMFGPEGEFGGFVLNIVVSFIAMALGTFMGLWLGLGQVSPNRFISRGSWAITQLFRNSPWLVLLFYFMLLLPFFIRIGDTRIEVSGWAKATFALSLPIMANVSEIVRGSIASIPTGQW
ncbi:MAG: ABC transporter permease subunit, partial [Xanthomonadales bacterium]|nr:ABC transporter permease subunit [Xanthomonadales bacterium]